MASQRIASELTEYLEHGKKFLLLDGLRGYAIAFVVLFHCVWSGPQLAPSHRSFFGNFGWTGVDLFFVLSGFLITNILLQTRNSPVYFKNFYVRRILRIFPVYYAYLLFMLLYYRDASGIFYHLTYTSNFYIILNTQIPEHTPAWLTWSLAIEEQFYLMWPLLIYFLNKKWATTVVSFFIVAAPLFRYWLYFNEAPPYFFYVFTLTRIDALSYGALIALLLSISRDNLHILTRIAWGLVVLSPIGLYLVWSQYNAFFFIYNPHTVTIGFTLTALFYAAILVLSISYRSVFINLLLKNRFILLVGKHSYCMYLIHGEIVYFFRSIFMNTEILQKFLTDHTHVGMLIFNVNVLISTLLVAILIWHLLEKHFINMKSLFPYRIQGSSN